MRRIIKNALKILQRTEQKKLAVFILLNLFISILDIASLATLVLLVSIYTQSNFHNIFTDRIHLFATNDSLLPVAVFLGLFIAKSIAGYLALVAQYRYVYGVAARISTYDLVKYLEGSYSDYVNIDSSIHVRRIMHQPIEFAHYVLTGILQIITESILTLLTVIVIVVFNARLFLLLALIMLPAIMILSYVTKRKLQQARAHAKTSSEKTLQYLHEALAGYIESNIYDKTTFFTTRYNQLLQKMTRYLSDLETTQGMPSRLVEVFAVLGLFLIIAANKYLGSSASMEVINIGAFMAAAYKIIPGIVKITNLAGQVKTYEYTVNDLLSDNYKTRPSGASDKEAITSIVFNKVCFRHDKQDILNEFNVGINKGEFIGLSGPSGKGKTTFVNLLLGFLSQEAGDILINNTIANETERQQYWKNISYVQQRPFMIHDTLTANIVLGDEHNAGRLAEVINAAGLNEFIGQYPEGLGKVVTENGKNISGGQRQRIALARALYKNSDVIIFDEPFNGIDAHSEKHILGHLRSLSGAGKIIILITHKNENLLYCDKTYSIG